LTYSALFVNLIQEVIMTVIELKEKLIAKINSTDNEELLDHIADIIELESADSIYKLSPEEYKAVSDGIAQIEDGHFLTNEDANKIIDKCLGR
jgi:predicted transcriptional regulator